MLWENLPLYKLLCREPVKEFNVSACMDLHNQRVIRCDVDRTRSGEITADERDLLEVFLTFYCKDTGVSYKQGMNEVFVPFLLLVREGMPCYIAYTCFKQFIHLCLRTMFEDDTFRPLQGLFIIMNLLLKYHVPKVSNFLQEHDISPELYSTSWFLTMYATKVNSIDLLYLLWELIVRENDSIFPCYLGVALLEKYSNEILGKEYALIPLALNKISINSKSEIYQLVDRSKEFKQYLPVSTSTKLKNYDIFNLKNIDSYTAALAKSTCLSILPREILHLTYPETKICNCENVCDLCKNAYPIVIIDCRSKEMQDQGYFPNTEFFSENLTRNPNAIMEFVSRFEEIKGIYHFALLGSEDVKYDNQGQESGNTITQLIRGFLALEFPHISVVEGGFSSCHEFAMHYKLQIKGHLPSNCDLCKKQAKVLGKKQKNVEKKIQEDLREKIRITNTMQTFECKKYDKKLKGNLPENFLFVISFEHAFLADSERNICEKFELKELVKITKVNHSNKTLIFYFANVKEKKSYSFLNKKKAEECRQKVSVAFRSLKNGMLSDFV